MSALAPPPLSPCRASHPHATRPAGLVRRCLPRLGLVVLVVLLLLAVLVLVVARTPAVPAW